MTDENKYFTPVEFPELEEPEEEQVDAEDPLNDIDITVQMTEVRRMVQAIETGQSTIINKGLMLTKSPVMKAMRDLEQFPSVPHLFTFLDLAKQDVNLRFRRECVLILKQHPKLQPILEGRDDA